MLRMLLISEIVHTRKLLSMGMPESAWHVDLDYEDENDYAALIWTYYNEEAGEHIISSSLTKTGTKFLIGNLFWYRDTEDN